MAATKTIEDFPGAYSGQGRSWERMVRGQIEVLPMRDGLKPKIVLKPRAPPTLKVTAAPVEESDRSKYGSTYVGVADKTGKVTPRKLARSLEDPVSGVSTLPPATTVPASTSGTAAGVSGTPAAGHRL